MLYLGEQKSVAKTEIGQKKRKFLEEEVEYLKQKKIFLEKDTTEIEKRANALADEEASRNIDLFIKSNEFRKILKEKVVDLKKVVNVSSSAGQLFRIPSEELKKKFSSETLTEEELCSLMTQFVNDAKAGNHEKIGWGKSAYAVSKVGVNALTFVQHRNFLQDSREDIVINAVHPGYVDTDMTSHRGPLTIDEGAKSSVYCALLPPNVESPRGQFIWEDCTIASWT